MIHDLDPNKKAAAEMQMRAQIASGAAEIARAIISNPEFLKQAEIFKSAKHQEAIVGAVFSFSMSLSANYSNFVFQEPKRILDS